MLPAKIDFSALAVHFERHVREKAIRAGNTIVYVIDGQMIEEDPTSSVKTVLKTVSYSLKP